MTQLLRISGAFAALVLTCSAHAQGASELRERHTELRESLNQNAYQRPIHLDSTETPGGLQGDIYARIAQPWAVVGPSLRELDNWCDILILHLNVKGCGTSAPGQPAVLSLNIGRKFDQKLEDTHRIAFEYRVVTAQPDYLQVALTAKEGPMGTSNYRMLLEVVALDPAHSFLHLSYAYAYGMSARIGMRGYLATKGRDKRGFSVVGQDDQGQPILIGGTRGVVERNTMRYYLAIEAYLGAVTAPASLRQEKRLNAWHAGIENYPQQLRELDRNEYMAMKRREIARQEAGG